MIANLKPKELIYFMDLYRQYPHNKNKVIEAFTLWGINKYQYGKYSLPNFLKRVEKLKLFVNNTK